MRWRMTEGRSRRAKRKSSEIREEMISAGEANESWN